MTYELAHGSAEQRTEAVRQLAQYPAQAARDALLLALEDNELEVRLQAAQTLGALHAREAVPALVEWLDDRLPAVRAGALRALGSIAGAREHPRMARGLADPEAEVRLAAVQALAAQTGETRALLLPALADADGGVRLAAIEALASEPDESALAPLQARLSDDSPAVRAAAVRALGRLHDERRLAALSHMLSDSDERVRLSALAALGDANSGQAVAALSGQLHADTRSARTALAALGRIDDPSAQDALLAQLSQAELAPSATAALLERARRQRLLGATQPAARSVNALAAALQSATNPEHVTTLADTLETLAEFAEIGPAKDALLACLSEGRGDARALGRALGCAAPEALLPALLERMDRVPSTELTPVLAALEDCFAVGLGDGRATEPLLAKLATATGQARWQLLHLVGLTHAPRALPALLPLLKSTASTDQALVIDAIGHLAAPESRALLWPLLEAAEPKLRRAAGRALATSADAALVNALMDALEHGHAADPVALLESLGLALSRLPAGQPDTDTRSRALRLLAERSLGRDALQATFALGALRAMHDPRALPSIARLLRQPDVGRRAAALFALADFPGEDTRRLLRFVLLRDAGRVSVAAAAALAEVGDQRDAVALQHAAERGPWPVPIAATYALARMAQRGVMKKYSLQRVLCELGRSTDPYVRANVAAGMAALSASACEDGVQPLPWLDATEPIALRVAAATWAESIRANAHEPQPALARALSASERSLDPQLARAATKPAPPPTAASSTLLIEAYAPDAQTHLYDRLLALRLPNASVFVGYSDAAGQLRVPGVVGESVVLEDPADARTAPKPVPVITTTSSP